MARPLVASRPRRLSGVGATLRLLQILRVARVVVRVVEIFGVGHHVVDAIAVSIDLTLRGNVVLIHCHWQAGNGRELQVHHRSLDFRSDRRIFLAEFVRLTNTIRDIWIDVVLWVLVDERPAL